MQDGRLMSLKSYNVANHLAHLYRNGHLFWGSVHKLCYIVVLILQDNITTNAKNWALRRPGSLYWYTRLTAYNFIDTFCRYIFYCKCRLSLVTECQDNFGSGPVKEVQIGDTKNSVWLTKWCLNKIQILIRKYHFNAIAQQLP